MLKRPPPLDIDLPADVRARLKDRFRQAGIPDREGRADLELLIEVAAERVKNPRGPLGNGIGVLLLDDRDPDMQMLVQRALAADMARRPALATLPGIS